MPTSPERRAELVAALIKLMGLPPPPKPKPKEVVSDGEVFRDAVVHGDEKVRRNCVVIRMDLWQEQQRQKEEDRRHRREIDPSRYGHWSGDDD